MALALTIIGLLILISGARGTHKDLGNLLKEDFTGKDNFFIWIAALGIVGALGYIKELQTFSRWFMALLIVVLLFSQRGSSFFNQLRIAFESISPTESPAYKETEENKPDIGGSLRNPLDMVPRPFDFFRQIPGVDRIF